jgi:hypothetical protein
MATANAFDRAGCSLVGIGMMNVWKTSIAKSFSFEAWAWLSGQTEFIDALEKVHDSRTAEIALHVGLNLEANRPRPSKGSLALRGAEVCRIHRATLEKKLQYLLRRPLAAPTAISKVRSEIAELTALHDRVLDCAGAQ